MEGRAREGDGEGEGGRDRMDRKTSRRRPKMSKWEKEEEGSGLWSYSKSKTRGSTDNDYHRERAASSIDEYGSGSPGLTPLTTSSTFASSSSLSNPARQHDEDHVPLYPEFRSIEEEFDFSTPSTSASPSTTTPTSNASTTATELPTTFSNPPLMPGLVDSIKDVLGARAKPTAIQALAIQHLVEPLSDSAASRTTEHESVESEAVGEVETKAQPQYRQFLLASETGSGKSIAYLLPLLQSLKQSELSPSSSPSSTHQLRGDNHGSQRPTPLNPRALILAPTHELSRQLATFGKGLIHNIKLRVMSASRANVPNDGRSSSRNAGGAELNVRAGGERNMSASRMAKAFDHESEGGEFEVSGNSTRGKGRDVDVLVGTPKRLLEMAMGHGWDKEAVRNAEGAKGRKWVVGPREVGLEGVEWVVVDEADTLLGMFLLSRILVSKDLF